VWCIPAATNINLSITTDMKSFIAFIVFYFLALFSTALFAQSQKQVVITGARFTYPLLEKWIADYEKINPEVKITIAPRTTTDPAQYDLLIEAYELTPELREQREVLHIGRYALLPVANQKSPAARALATRGADKDELTQLYFHDLFAKKEKDLSFPYVIYTRQQKSGPSITFASFFGYEHQQIKGKSIAGSDEHLIQAVLKDTLALSYNHPGLIYDLNTRSIKQGLTLIPIDLNGNGKISSEEKTTRGLDDLLQSLESNTQHLAVGNIHLSIPKEKYNQEALRFLLWVSDNGLRDLHAFGLLSPDAAQLQADKEKFELLTSSIK